MDFANNVVGMARMVTASHWLDRVVAPKIEEHMFRKRNSLVYIKLDESKIRREYFVSFPV